MNPLTQEQINTAKSFTAEQKEMYNRFRSAGISPQSAFNSIVDKNPQQTQKKEDNIFTGENSLVQNVSESVVNALNPKKLFQEVGQNIDRYGAARGIIGAPLSAAAQLGRGVGGVVGAVAETVDDLTGEIVSDAVNPLIQRAVQSDLGQQVIRGAENIDRATLGIASDVFDASELLGVAGAFRALPKQAARTVASEAVESSVRRGTRGLRDFMPTVVDTVVEGGLEAIDAVRKIPEGIANSAKRSIDRRIERIAFSEPLKAQENIVDLYKKAIVPGVKKKAKTISNISKIENDVKIAVPELAKKYDVENIEDFANAISSEKRDIFQNIEAGLQEAGDAGRAINTKTIVDELDSLLNSERAEFSSALRTSIQKAKNELIDQTPDGQFIQYKNVSPRGAQDIIADINARLQSYYRGAASGTNADVIVDNLVVNNLKKAVDDVVENLGEGSFAQLKRRYAALKSMEDDVVHRAVFEAQKGRGLSDLTDIMSAGDIVAGSLDPAFLLRGASQFLTKEVIKSLTDKDELVRQMFLYGKNLN